MKTVKPRILDLRKDDSPSDGSFVTVGEGETLVVIAVPSSDRPAACKFHLAPKAKIFVRSLVFPGTSADFEIVLA